MFHDSLEPVCLFGESYAENISLVLDSAFLSLLLSELTQSKSDLFSSGGPFSVSWTHHIDIFKMRIFIDFVG